jgi:hypothetical protein
LAETSGEISMIRSIYSFLFVAILIPAGAGVAAASQEAAIQYLLDAVESSSCRFVRNDITYSSREFLGHLQSKMALNEELIGSAEEFIEKIATRSAVSEIPYVAICDGQLKITQDWFFDLLANYRSNN